MLSEDLLKIKSNKKFIKNFDINDIKGDVIIVGKILSRYIKITNKMYCSEKCENNKLISVDTLNKFTDFIDWNELSKSPFLTLSLLLKNIDKLNKKIYIKYEHKYINIYDSIKKLNIKYDFDNYDMKESEVINLLDNFYDDDDFIIRYNNRINWGKYSRYAILSENIMRKFFYKIDWVLISRYQKISIDFINDYHQFISWDEYFKNTQNIVDIKTILKYNNNLWDTIIHNINLPLDFVFENLNMLKYHLLVLNHKNLNDFIYKYYMHIDEDLISQIIYKRYDALYDIIRKRLCLNTTYKGKEIMIRTNYSINFIKIHIRVIDDKLLSKMRKFTFKELYELHETTTLFNNEIIHYIKNNNYSIMEYLSKYDINFIIKFMNVPETILKIFDKNTINYHLLMKNQTLSENYVIENMDKFKKNKIIKYVSFSEDNINKYFLKKKYMNDIIIYQNVSEKFIENNIKKISLELLIKNIQNISEEFLMKHCYDKNCDDLIIKYHKLSNETIEKYFMKNKKYIENIIINQNINEEFIIKNNHIINDNYMLIIKHVVLSENFIIKYILKYTNDVIYETLIEYQKLSNNFINTYLIDNGKYFDNVFFKNQILSYEMILNILKKHNDNISISYIFEHQYLNENEIETRPFFAGNIIKQPAYKGIKYRISNNLDNTDKAMFGTFFIGCHPALTEDMINHTLKKFEEFFNKS